VYSYPKRKILEDRNAHLLAGKARPCLDVRTRWNSTHDIISSVLPYAEIIDTMTDLEFEDINVDPDTMALTSAKVTLPSFGETYQCGFWYKLEQLRDFLKPLKETTVTLSARKTPTAHLVVGETHILDKEIDKVEPLEDDCLVKSADKMALKFVKYYGSLQPQFVIAHILDPRVKTKFVETLQDTELKISFSNTIRSSFDKWFKGTNLPSMEDKPPVDYDTQSTIDQLRGELNYNSLIAALSHGAFAKGSNTNNEDISPSFVDDLQLYLSDPIEPYLSNNQQFDLLSWWRKMNTSIQS
jgi:hypothetical protein